MALPEPTPSAALRCRGQDRAALSGGCESILTTVGGGPPPDGSGRFAPFPPIP